LKRRSVAIFVLPRAGARDRCARGAATKTSRTAPALSLAGGTMQHYPGAVMNICSSMSSSGCSLEQYHLVANLFFSRI